jgi:hypothetical protein
MGGERSLSPLLSDLCPAREARPDAYRFIELWDAFRVEHPLRHPVEVRVRASALQVVSAAATFSFDLPCPPLELCRVVARLLLGLPGKADDRPPPQLSRETWAIADPVHRLRAALLRRAAPIGWRVQERLVAVAGEVSELAQDDAFYRDPFVVRDVLRHRAAAVALARLEKLWPHYRARRGIEAAPTVEVLARAMGEWRCLFSPDGRTYRSLDRTLMNLGDETSLDLLCQLPRVRLERPIVSSLELRTVLTLASLANVPLLAERMHVLQHAHEVEIGAALERVGGETERRLDPADDRDLRFVVRYLADFPHSHRGRLGRLVERAIEWHRTVAERREVSETVERLGGTDTPTARPPIPLPRFKGVRFLSTVGEVAAEGLRMRHCITSFASEAVHGRAFLFHVDHGGEPASFEIDPDGDVLQAAGPGNTSNAAVEYGLRRLEKWARGFHRRQPSRSRPPQLSAENLDQLGFPFA